MLFFFFLSLQFDAFSAFNPFVSGVVFY